MTMLRLSASTALAAAALALTVAPAQAATHPLVSGQSLSLPLNEEPDGPTLKVVVKSAEFTGLLIVPNENRTERKARGNQVPLDTIDGKNLVKFIRATADDLRARGLNQPNPRSVVVTATFVEKTRIDQSGLWGDALKAGFTFGLANSATTPLYFVSHIDLAVDGQTYSCDAEAQGRIPTYPRKNDPHAHDAADKMAEDARKACWAQIADKIGATFTAPGAAPIAAEAAPAAPAAAAAPAEPAAPTPTPTATTAAPAA
jgi:hypothetical protein